MSNNCCGADKLFNLKAAKKELRKYKKTGTGKPTRTLIKAIGSANLEGKSLLDIGGGIGAIQWDFLKNGGARTTDLDYSDGYLEVAKTYAEENDWSDQSKFIQGDFLENGDTIESHDFVTMDKVVCCYPDYQGLLIKALNKCNHTVGLVYPIDGFVARMIMFAGRMYLRLTGNSFRPYIHPVASIRQLARDQGFESVHSSISFPWHVEVYRRV